MNNNLKPIDQLLDNWEAIRLNHEMNLYRKLDAQSQP